MMEFVKVKRDTLEKLISFAKQRLQDEDGFFDEDDFGPICDEEIENTIRDAENAIIQPIIQEGLKKQKANYGGVHRDA